MSARSEDARPGLTFHRTFALSLPQVAEVLTFYRHHEGSRPPSTRDLREATALGTVQAEAMPRYARHCGLIEINSHRLTPLGEVVYRHDPQLRAPTTLWLLHYHLSAPHGPGPAFWSHLVTHCLPFGREITGRQVVNELAFFLSQQTTENAVQTRTLQSTKTIFLGTYTKLDGLGQLGLLTRIGGDSDDRVRVADPQLPPAAVVGYALADYWDAHYPTQIGVSVSELARSDGFARILWMDPQRFEEALDGLRRDKVLEIYRSAPPYQVMRRWLDKRELLDRLYCSDRGS